MRLPEDELYGIGAALEPSQDTPLASAFPLDGVEVSRTSSEPYAQLKG